MNVQAMQTTAVDGYLRFVEAPIRIAAKLIGGEETQQGTTLVIDRMDATVRRSVGRLLNNEELQADAAARLVAAEERERATKLRAAASRVSTEADREFSDAKRDAERKRADAKARAEQQEAHIEQAKSERERRIEAEERERKAAVADTKAQADRALATKEKKDRLDHLNLEADALAQQEAALDRTEEAERLKQSAAKAKAARKI